MPHWLEPITIRNLIPQNAKHHWIVIYRYGTAKTEWAYFCENRYKICVSSLSYRGRFAQHSEDQSSGLTTRIRQNLFFRYVRMPSFCIRLSSLDSAVRSTFR